MNFVDRCAIVMARGGADVQKSGREAQHSAHQRHKTVILLQQRFDAVSVGLFAVEGTAIYLHRARMQQNKGVLWRWWIKKRGEGAAAFG